MWIITRNLTRKNLSKILSNETVHLSPAITFYTGKCLSNKANNAKSVSNYPVIEKNFPLKDVSSEEPVNGRYRNLPFALAFVSFSVALFGVYLFTNLRNGNDNKSWKYYYQNLQKQIKDLTTLINKPSREKLLPDPVQYPYYQPKYTLILEFTDVIAHPDWTYNTGWRFKKRPGLDYMLENLVGSFEIVVFTAQPGMTIFPVIDALDPKSLISYKLVRDSTHFVDGHHVKNLEKLNRDLKKVIVIDWNPESVKFHPDNLLNIPRWKGENDDMALIDLTCFLKTIASTDIEDVREVLKFYRQYEDPLREFHMKYREYIESKDSEQMQKIPMKSTLLT